MSGLVNHVLCLALIAVSGNPAVREFGFEAAIVTMFLATGMVFLARPKRVMPGSLVFLVAVGGLLGIQVGTWGEMALFASIGFMVQMCTALMIVSAVPGIVPVFVRCMAALSVLSLVFYVGFQVPGRVEALAPFVVYRNFIETNIGLHNFRNFGYEGQHRNSGMFWEPGAFAGYLALALYLAVLLRTRLPWRWLIMSSLVAALLTTLSTMGYAALSVVLFAWIIRPLSRRNPLLAVLALPLVLGLVGSAAWVVGDRLPFLTDKVSEQFERAEGGEESSELNRFGNALYDLRFVELRPLLGWSANPDTRRSVDWNADLVVAAQGNALTGLAARFGIIGWLLLIGGFATALLRASGSAIMASLGLVLLAVMFTGEQYMNYPLIMILYHLQRRHLEPTAAYAFRRRRKAARTAFRRRVRLEHADEKALA